MRDERGAGTVLALALTAVVVLVAFAVAGGTALVASHRVAQSAADLAALAGAQAMQLGGVDPCARAADVARRNGATLERCRIEGWSVAVTVLRVSPPLLGRVSSLRARSRAGPVTSGSGVLGAGAGGAAQSKRSGSRSSRPSRL